MQHHRMLAPALLFIPALLVADARPVAAQERQNPPGEWRYQSADAWGTRFSPVDQINAGNFGELEVAWVWRADNFGPGVDPQMKSTPTYIDGILYTVAGQRRTVAAIDPATGETIWTYREPHTTRWERSMRQNYGKGVAYGELDGRGVIYYTSPAFFLHALDAKTGRHIDGFGQPVPIEGFPETGVVDMLPPLLDGWGPWMGTEQDYDPDYGIPRALGYITTSSPPIVVDGWSWSGTPPSRGTTRRASRTCRATSSASTRARASSAGSSTSFRAPARSATRLGKTTPGSTPATCRRGRRCRPTTSGDRLHPDQPAHDRLLRRLPPGQQSVFDERDRPGRVQRRARMALPDRAQRPVELRPAQCADRRGPDGGRAGGSRGDPDHQDRPHLRLQPRDGRADLAR